MYIRQWLGLFCAIILTPHVYADTLQALDEIEQAVYLHANHDALTNYDMPQVIVEPLDRRLRLQACTNQLETFSNSAANSIGKPNDWGTLSCTRSVDSLCACEGESDETGCGGCKSTVS